MFSIHSQTNTFQAALATDGTRAFILFNYKIDDMTWDYENLAVKDLIIGYNAGNGHYVNAHLDDPPFSTPASQFRPDQYLGTTGLQVLKVLFLHFVLRVSRNCFDFGYFVFIW